MKWEKPKLIVLVRGKPEDNVLWPCKTMFENGPGGIVGQCVPNQDIGWCTQDQPS